MLIDFHTHIFPDALAARTLQKLSAIAQCAYHTDGTVAGTLQKFDEWGTDYGVVLHIATRPGQEGTINRFAKQIQEEHPKLLCFGTVFPDSENAVEAVQQIKELGLYGIKLHPAYQHCFIREEKYFPLYEAAAEAGLPITMHAGWDPVEPKVVYSPPEDIAFVARSFPNLTIIAAHMGGLMLYQEAEEHLCGLPNVYLDTAMSSVYCGPAQYERLIRNHGADRVLFGTDCPWNTVPAEKAFLEATTLSRQEKDKILYQNARALLHLPG
ncbi:amidohydrolase family protein [Anaerotruncus rubiinfantis]|uniref:amidohydrolase family protein n=1 Tax=Anaerotruncus rubiinfantis TaxID=1720200 RepID=UPI0011C7A9EE|nr:amidohydrolase family protein [Anaerotruncus rubiinfantis]